MRGFIDSNSELADILNRKLINIIQASYELGKLGSEKLFEAVKRGKMPAEELDFIEN